MTLVNRRVTYKLHPSVSQEAAMWKTHKLHCDLHNTALQERIDGYRLAGKTIGFAAQSKSLTEIRAEHPEYLAVNAQSAQVTLKRLDLSFDAFFRRVKEGQAPGFPRFKSYDRFPGFGFKHHGDGFLFTPGPGWRNGRLRLSGIGTMSARGEARTPGKVISADIMRKVDGWFLSLVIECEPHRECGDREAGLDWGVETFAPSPMARANMPPFRTSGRSMPKPRLSRPNNASCPRRRAISSPSAPRRPKKPWRSATGRWPTGARTSFTRRRRSSSPGTA